MSQRNVQSVGPYGGTNPSNSYDEKFTGINNVTLQYSKDGINSMTIEYDDNGKHIRSTKHGDVREFINGAGVASISFSSPDEYLLSVSGTYDSAAQSSSDVQPSSSDIVLTSLTFETNKKIYQGYGSNSGTKFSFTMPRGGKIVGFHGTYGNMLNSIGVYYELYSHQIESFGGVGEKSWDDGVNRRVSRIIAWGDPEIRGIGFVYDEEEKSIPSRRCNDIVGIRKSMIHLGLDEYIVHVSGFIDTTSSPNYITSITFVSNLRRYEPFGRKQGGTHFMFPPGGGRILGFYGTYGPDHLHSIGAYTEQEPVLVETLGPFGSSSGNEWDDGRYDGIKKIEIYFTEFVDAINIQYVDSTGNFTWSRRHGSINEIEGQRVEISLEYPEEVLFSVKGHCDTSDKIKSLTFKSNKHTYGPYGREEGESFSISKENTKIIGLCGRDDNNNNNNNTHIKAIGAHVMYFLSSHRTLLGPFGGEGEIKWEVGPCDLIKKIVIGYDTFNRRIRSIRFEYIKDGNPFSERHGSETSENHYQVVFEENEFLTSVIGYHYNGEGCNNALKFRTKIKRGIKSLKFKTNKNNTWGPYGDEKGTIFSLGNDSTNIIGFTGSSNADYIVSIGAYVIDQ